MKKGIILSLVAGALFATTGCGEKFTPMTEEQKNAKVEEMYTAQKDAKLNELRTACQAGMEAQVSAKVETLKSAETATTN